VAIGQRPDQRPPRLCEDPASALDARPLSRFNSFRSARTLLLCNVRFST
jgi:hypothetical protein